MNARLEALAIQKQLLLERSALCRLRLRRDVFAVRATVRWTRVPDVLAAPTIRTLAWSAAISLLGVGRAGRILLFAGRAVMVAKLARAAIGYARGPARMP